MVKKTATQVKNIGELFKNPIKTNAKAIITKGRGGDNQSLIKTKAIQDNKLNKIISAVKP